MQTAPSEGMGQAYWFTTSFGNRKDVTEEQRSPCSDILLAGFISTLAGVYSWKTISNYVSGVRAWHIIHGVPWVRNKGEADALIKAAKRLTP
jgi:hypothetical protein